MCQSLVRPWAGRISQIFLRVLQQSIISVLIDEVSGWEGVDLPTVHIEDLKLVVSIQSLLTPSVRATSTSGSWGAGDR